MSERYYTEFAVPRAYCTDFVKDLFKETFEEVDWWNSVFYGRSYEANYGDFNELEKYLKGNKIPYNQWTESIENQQAVQHIYRSTEGIDGDYADNFAIPGGELRDAVAKHGAVEAVRLMLEKYAPEFTALEDIPSFVVECPDCHHKYTVDDWNAATADSFGSNITKLEELDINGLARTDSEFLNCNYRCPDPGCGFERTGQELRDYNRKERRK